MSKTKAPERGYHHGDARNALLSAAAGLLEKVGAAGLSLRQVAEQAGLSRQAPYNHFQDKQALLAELVREGFEKLTDCVAAGVDPGAETALAHAAEGYIRFARQHPALFRLMFSRELVDVSNFPAAQRAAAECFGKLVEIVACFGPADQVQELSLAAWSIVHGYSTLCIESGLEHDDRSAERARLFARIIRSGASCQPAQRPRARHHGSE